MYLLPTPNHFRQSEGYFTIKYDTRLLTAKNTSRKETYYLRLLQEDVSKILSFDLPLGKAWKVEDNSIFLDFNTELGAQGFSLTISESCIEIFGGGTEGLLYGVQTLRQIISQKGARLPCLEIKDAPELPVRGFYHDVTRGRIPTLQTLKELAQQASYYKLNQLQLYIEHSFLFKNFSEVWRDDTPLTAEDILEFDEYCQDLNIELVPSIASFGHLHKVLSTRSFAHLCELENPEQEPFTFVSRMIHHTLDISNPASFEMIQEMLLEFIPLFSSKKFNICADETFDLGKGKSKPLADEVGVHRIYVDFVNKLCNFVKEQGLQPMFWGDIIVGSPALIQELPEDVLCLNWGYGANEQENNTQVLHEAGAVQYLCPGVHGWRRFLNRLDYAYENITRMCSYAFKYNAAGLLNTDWGDYGHINFVRCSTPGMIYGAAFSWNRETLSFDEINRRISVLAFGDRTESFVDIVASIAKRQLFGWENAVQYLEAHTNGLSEKEIHEYFTAIPLTDIEKTRRELEELTQRLYDTMMSMEESKRSLVKEYLIMAKAILLFNNIGAILKNNRFGGSETIGLSPAQTAAALECWWNDYKAIWREHSKEGELFRIQDVLFWYADLLRSL